MVFRHVRGGAQRGAANGADGVQKAAQKRLTIIN